MKHLSLIATIYLTAFFLSLTVKAQGIQTVQPKSGAVFTTVASGTTLVSGTVTVAPGGTQTVNGTVTCTPSGTQTITGSVAIDSTTNYSREDGITGTIYSDDVQVTTSPRRLAVNANGVCNNTGQKRFRLQIYLPSGSASCYLGGSGVTSSAGLKIDASSEPIIFDRDNSDYYAVCNSTAFIYVMETCR